MDVAGRMHPGMTCAEGFPNLFSSPVCDKGSEPLMQRADDYLPLGKWKAPKSGPWTSSSRSGKKRTYEKGSEDTRTSTRDRAS
ncbi:hypothetical protein BaRGS_00000971 [Batillaria attramentaria]|uniref:Uncharacterized protein n=1 Tax=Batillaria attramentaria TaxID=370345 RepID=A0ABD0M9D0_9CAEN